jgi:hypothetical protein
LREKTLRRFTYYAARYQDFGETYDMTVHDSDLNTSIHRELKNIWDRKSTENETELPEGCWEFCSLGWSWHTVEWG